MRVRFVSRYKVSPASTAVPESGARRVRWDSLAAIASALAAFASALIAWEALRYLPRQEDLVKAQVEATYLNNLYSKQVDAFAEFKTALVDVIKAHYVQRLRAVEHDGTTPDPGFTVDYVRPLVAPPTEFWPSATSPALLV